MSWTEEAYQRVLPIIERTHSHPMILALAHGTLNLAIFRIYLEQDRIYLRNYAEEMQILKEMLPEGRLKELFGIFANDSLQAEMELNTSMGIEEKPAMNITESYMSHTRKCIESGKLSVAMASLLPCMWIYNETGRYIASIEKSEDNPYHEWISLYSSPMMDEGAELCKRLCDSLAESAADDEKEEMFEVFEKSVEMEYLFWDQAYKG